jgi:hypothetical protein
MQSADMNDPMGLNSKVLLFNMVIQANFFAEAMKYLEKSADLGNIGGI